MQTTQNERNEWQRAAKALYARGANKEGSLLSVAASKMEITLDQFDRAGSVYRAWLCRDEPKQK